MSLLRLSKAILFPLYKQYGSSFKGWIGYFKFEFFEKLKNKKKGVGEIYKQCEEAPGDFKKMNDIAYGIASKKILLTKKSNK